jgi:hypothetical protein
MARCNPDAGGHPASFYCTCPARVRPRPGQSGSPADWANMDNRANPANWANWA